MTPSSVPQTSATTSKSGRRWYRPSLKRVRTFCLIAALGSCAVLAVSSRYTLEAFYTTVGWNMYRFGLSDGEVNLYWAGLTEYSAGNGRALTLGFRFEAEENWGNSVSLAWRPYHIGVQPGFNTGDPHHGFAFPLWLAALPAVIAAAYTHGLLVGMRRGDKGRCAKCGYDRTGLAEGSACPECGGK